MFSLPSRGLYHCCPAPVRSAQLSKTSVSTKAVPVPSKALSHQSCPCPSHQAVHVPSRSLSHQNLPFTVLKNCPLSRLKPSVHQSCPLSPVHQKLSMSLSQIIVHQKLSLFPSPSKLSPRAFSPPKLSPVPSHQSCPCFRQKALSHHKLSLSPVIKSCSPVPIQSTQSSKLSLSCLDHSVIKAVPVPSRSLSHQNCPCPV